MTKDRLLSLRELGFDWKRERQTNYTWEERLQQLADYKKEFGNTNVPETYEKNKPLGQWVKNQKRQCRLLEEGRHTSMTKDRLISLRELGFDLKAKRSMNYTNSTWEERLQQLAEYKKEFGNTNVPQRYEKNKRLGRWVMLQKRQCRLLEEGKRSSMTKNHLLSLRELGFDWKRERETNFTWEERLQQLAEYKKEFGNTNVPERYEKNKQLGHWVKNQKRQCMLLEEGKQSTITKERLLSLKELGFEWNSKSSKIKSSEIGLMAAAGANDNERDSDVTSAWV